MFYYLYQLNALSWEETPLRVLKYITVRTVAAAGTAFILTLIIGPYIIAALRKFKLGQIIRNADDLPDLYKIHASKQGTPTMGGIIIISAITVSMLLWGAMSNLNVRLVLMSMVYMGLVGLWDDFRSISKKRSKGLRSRVKFILQVVWTGAVVFVLNSMPETKYLFRQLMVPFLKEPLVADMGLFVTFLFMIGVIVGCSNAVNLTDGLDGLAIGCSSSVALCYLVMSYVSGHVIFSEYLSIPHVQGAGELAVFCGALAGACLGFLWFNCHPAQVFMGDTGSLALGGSIAMVAVLIKQEIALIIVGGVFVMEALSVMLQVASFKLTGKRIFAMAPIHHHFELKQWSETQVVVRFWIISILFALLGILTLKMR
jgi:phospho-N-acetylmuramoyl-pentapeptide-transferase